MHRSSTLAQTNSAITHIREHARPAPRTRHRPRAGEDEDAIRLVGQGKRVPQPRMDCVYKMRRLGYNERKRSLRADWAQERGRPRGAVREVNGLAVTITGLPAFLAYAKDVLEVLRPLGRLHSWGWLTPLFVLFSSFLLI